MKTSIFLCTLLGLALAEPNGYYHQEYNYKASSASYRNNELQHRNDDEGYYSKDGDLEGRVRPRVNTHNQHSEYINPKLQHSYQIADGSASFGQLHAEMGEMGAFGYMGQGGGYAVNSDLRQITTNIQEELTRELQRAVYDHYQRAIAYGQSITQAQAEADMRALEEELRRNVTVRLQEALKNQYGNQGIRGGYSYTILNGRLQPTANYNNQELAELTRQMEAHLMRQLEQQMQTYYHTTVNTEVHTRRNTYRRVNGVSGNYPPSPLQRPPPPPMYPQPQPPMPQPHPPHPQPVHTVHIPVHVPDSITTIATRVQTELNEHLNRILEDIEKRYFSSESFHHLNNYNLDQILAQLQEELRANITFHLDDQIKRTYGFSNYASKYSVEDVENLRRQIEHNLLTKLTRDFNRQRERFYETHMTNTPVYQPIPSQPIPSQPIPRPLHHPIPPANQIYYPVTPFAYQGEVAHIQRQLQETLSRQLQSALMEHSYRNAHLYTGGNFNPQAHYQETLERLTAELHRNLTQQLEQYYNSQSYHQSATYQAQLANMRNQLQMELMRQLQQGLQQSYSRFSSWNSAATRTTSTNFRQVRGFDNNVYRNYGQVGMMGEDCMMGDDPSAYQQEPDKRVKRDLYSQGPNEQQVQTHDDLTQQVQTLNDPELTQQIQDLNQDLTQQVQTHDALTQQVQNHDDLTQQVQTHDELRQPDLTQQSIGQTQDFSPEVPTQQSHYQFQTPYNHQNRLIDSRPHNSYTPVYRRRFHQQPDSYVSRDGIVGQRVRYYEGINQPYYTNQYPMSTNQSPLQTQQTWRPPALNNQYYQTSYRKPTQPSEPLEQQAEDLDLTQQIQPVEQPQSINQYRQYPTVQKPLINEQYRQKPQQGQQTEDFDFTQQTQTVQEPEPRGQYRQNPVVQKPQVNYQYRQKPLGLQNQQLGQQIEDLDLTQQTQTAEELEPTSQYRQYPVVQEPQVNDQNRQKPLEPQNQQLGQQTENFDLTQQTQSTDLGQQTEDVDLDKLNSHSDLTQQVQQPDFGQLQKLEQSQQDLTQQMQSPTYTPSQSSFSHYITRPHPTYPSQVADLNQQTQTNNFEPYDRNQDLTQQTQDIEIEKPEPQPPSTYWGRHRYFEPLPQNEDLTQQRVQPSRPHYTPQYPQYRYRPYQWYQRRQRPLTQQSQQTYSTNLNQQQNFQQPLSQQSEDLTQRTQTNDFPSLSQLQSRNFTTPQQQFTDPLYQTEDLDLSQQTQEDDFAKLTQQQQSQELQSQQTENFDLTQQTQEDDFAKLTQQNGSTQLQQSVHPLSEQINDLDLTQQTQEDDFAKLTQQQSREPYISQYIKPQYQQQTEDLDLTQQTQDNDFAKLTQEDMTQHQSREPYFSQYSKPLYQQREGLTQQSQDNDFAKLTQQDLTQQTENVEQPVEPQRLGNKNQQLAQQVEDFGQPIEPQFGSNAIFKDEDPQKLRQQTEDLIQQEINQNQNQQFEEALTDTNSTQQSQQGIEQENQNLIDQLRNIQQNEPQNVNGPTQSSYYIPPQHSSQSYHRLQGPEYNPYNTQQTTEEDPKFTTSKPSQVPAGRSLINQSPNKLNYGTIDEEDANTEQVIDIEPVKHQTANEIQIVDDAKGTNPETPIVPPEQEEDIITTTKKPGFWSRLGTSIKNKALEYKEKIG